MTTDYLLEAFYCWIIEKLTHLSYGFEPTETYTWIDNASPAALAQTPHARVVKQVGPKAFIVDIPRYQEFTSIANALAAQQIQFVEIAGNTQISLSVIAPVTWRYTGENAHELFTQPILTNAANQRIVLTCRVPFLSSAVSSLRASGITVEHVYDY